MSAAKAGLAVVSQQGSGAGMPCKRPEHLTGRSGLAPCCGALAALMQDLAEEEPCALVLRVVEELGR